jgi:hypothetical protein
MVSQIDSGYHMFEFTFISHHWYLGLSFNRFEWKVESLKRLQLEPKDYK